MNAKLLFVGLLILSVVASACATKTVQTIEQETNAGLTEDPTNPQEVVENIIDLPKTCADLGGNWLSDYDECEGISQEDCKTLDGTFDECASACRHSPEAKICTLQCVQVCSFA